MIELVQKDVARLEVQNVGSMQLCQPLQYLDAQGNHLLQGQWACKQQPWLSFQSNHHYDLIGGLQQGRPAASSRRLAADLGYRVITMQASPSSLQQPSRRHARWHVPEASLKVCISFRKVLSAAAGAPQVCSRLTATCEAAHYFSFASTGRVWFL